MAQLSRVPTALLALRPSHDTQHPVTTVRILNSVQGDIFSSIGYGVTSLRLLVGTYSTLFVHTVTYTVASYHLAVAFSTVDLTCMKTRAKFWLPSTLRLMHFWLTRYIISSHEENARKRLGRRYLRRICFQSVEWVTTDAALAALFSRSKSRFLFVNFCNTYTRCNAPRRFEVAGDEGAS